MASAEPMSCGPPCPDVCPALLAGGGMWSTQLRSPQPQQPHGCGSEKQQALLLVAFPICSPASSASSAPVQSPCCCRCCNCGWNAKPPSPPAAAAACWPQPSFRHEEGQGAGSSSVRREEEEDRMEGPPSPPSLAVPSSGAGSDTQVDLSRVREAIRTLRISGYYYEGLSWEEAGRLLRGCPVGTFLVRDSSDNRFLFALSVQTERGPTSVRIHYRRGQFRLDCEASLSSCMPWFSCVVSLVEHYVQLSRTAKGQMCVWLDGHGRRDLPIVLTRPLYREPSSLQHLCRIAYNRSAKTPAVPACRTLEPLPSALKDYLREYPHLH